MVSSKSLISTALAGLALATVASAQTSQLNFEKVDGPMGQVHYDMATGKVTKLVRPREVAAGAQANASATQGGIQTASANCFLNTITSGYFTSGTLGREFVDWATKATGKPFTTALIFGYATRVAGTSIAGPGASLDLNFYSGTTGFCNLGTQFAQAAFTGLPGRTASIPPGFGAGYFITAFLASGLCIPDGNLGWGYTFLDNNGAGGSDTGPLLTDFGTNTGWADAFDSWAGIPASLNTCVGTFFFGGCSTGNVPPPPTGTPCSSFILGLSEFAPVTTAACVFRNTTNPSTLVVTAPPQIGGTFQAVVAGVGGLAVTAGPLPGVPLSGAINGSLLCDPTIIYGGIMVGAAFNIPVPKDAGLEGVGVCVQAAVFAGPGNFQLSNAYDCVLGG